MESAQEQRVDELSVQKLREESDETIQRLTSQIDRYRSPKMVQLRLRTSLLQSQETNLAPVHVSFVFFFRDAFSSADVGGLFETTRLRGDSGTSNGSLRSQLLNELPSHVRSVRATVRFRHYRPYEQRIMENLPHMKIRSRSSRPGLTVGFLRILCNGLCTVQRFHTEGEEQTCRFGCPDEPDSPSHYNECLLFSTCSLLSGDRLLCFHFVI